MVPSAIASGASRAHAAGVVMVGRHQLLSAAPWSGPCYVGRIGASAPARAIGLSRRCLAGRRCRHVRLGVARSDPRPRQGPKACGTRRAAIGRRFRTAPADKGASARRFASPARAATGAPRRPNPILAVPASARPSPGDCSRLTIRGSVAPLSGSGRPAPHPIFFPSGVAEPAEPPPSPRHAPAEVVSAASLIPRASRRWCRPLVSALTADFFRRFFGGGTTSIDPQRRTAHRQRLLTGAASDPHRRHRAHRRRRRADRQMGQQQLQPVETAAAQAGSAGSDGGAGALRVRSGGCTASGRAVCSPCSGGSGGAGGAERASGGRSGSGGAGGGWGAVVYPVMTGMARACGGNGGVASASAG